MSSATDDYAQTRARPQLRHNGSGTSLEYSTQLPRLRRKNSSRSQTRRQDSDPSAAAGNVFFQPWHLESNQRCNGGLKNAVASVKERLKTKLWIGTLGTSTDMFGDGLRKDIDKKMKEQCDSQPVWIPDAEFESCYDEFCHQVLPDRALHCVGIYTFPGALAVSTLCHSRCPQDQAFLRISRIQAICCG
jgi:trehalose 6-phosphate synthase/phosphatase